MTSFGAHRITFSFEVSRRKTWQRRVESAESKRRTRQRFDPTKCRNICISTTLGPRFCCSLVEARKKVKGKLDDRSALFLHFIGALMTSRQSTEIRNAKKKTSHVIAHRAIDTPPRINQLRDLQSNFCLFPFVVRTYQRAVTSPSICIILRPKVPDDESF